MKKILVLGHTSHSGCQMAAGYLHFFAGRIAAVYCAGPRQTEIHPSVVQVMLEDNIDIDDHPQQSLAQLSGHHFDYLIIVGPDTDMRLPRRPTSGQRLHWPLSILPTAAAASVDDPLHFFRQSRELIKKQVLKFVGQELLEPAILRG